MSDRTIRIWLALLVVGLSAGLTSGCIVAAAGAGAAAGIHVTSQGAEAELQSNINGTRGRVRAAFRRMGIELTDESMQDSGDKRTLKGSVDELDITVSLETRERGTHLEVTARRNLAQWDQEYAERLLSEIVGG